MNDEHLATSFASWLYGVDLGLENSIISRENTVAIRRFAASATLLASHAQQAYLAFHNGTTIATERENLVLSIVSPPSQN